MKIRLKDGTEFKISSLKYFYFNPLDSDTVTRYMVYFDFRDQNNIPKYIDLLRSKITNENASEVVLIQDGDVEDVIFKFKSVDILICETTGEGKLVIHTNFYPSED